jgi:hypothetical protein
MWIIALIALLMLGIGGVAVMLMVSDTVITSETVRCGPCGCACFY